MQINQAGIKCCFLSNQTIEFAQSVLFLFYYIVFGNKRGVRESDEKKKKEKIAGSGIILKIACITGAL